MQYLIYINRPRYRNRGILHSGARLIITNRKTWSWSGLSRYESSTYFNLIYLDSNYESISRQSTQNSTVTGEDGILKRRAGGRLVEINPKKDIMYVNASVL